MKIILREDIHTLGRSGEMVEVRDGYARNYLLPKKLAVVASEKNIRQLEHDRRVIAAHQAKMRASATAIAQKLEQVALTIARKVGDQDKLYGSVTALDIADALSEKGVRIDRRALVMPEPIKAIGQFEIDVRLHHDVTGKVKLEVVAEA
ncbi:MAG: 50S ribosomal protein L9 [Myxococcaceae bacterium]|nr:50S ribosomal protein L9 [Myxococcaceae bacterium]MBR2978497.1 50S ribosomal protein L9 [Myxococcaceae bacterium]